MISSRESKGTSLALSALLAVIALATLNASAGPDPATLFGDESPKVVIDSEQPWIDGPRFLSVADGVAVTTSMIRRADNLDTGKLLIWDLSEGRLRHVVHTPAKLKGVTGLRGSGQVVVVGGPVNKDETEEFMWIVDVRTGLKVREFNPVKSPFPLELRISVDRKSVLVPQNAGAAAYDLSGSTRNPRMVSNSVWESAPISSCHQANSLGDIPSWIPFVGDRDGTFALATDKHDITGIFRTDTWERVSKLGNQLKVWESWSASPDGSKMLSWRGDHSDGFTIWDFARFRVEVIEEPGFRPDTAPAFSEDGRWVRFKRETTNGEIEIVSKDWARGRETVDLIPIGRTFW